MSRTFNSRSTARGARKERQSRAETRHAQFIAELLRNGGNASAAARAVGYHPDHGRRLVSQNATVIATLAGLQERTEEEVREWLDLAPQAQQVLVELLDSDDDRVRFQAAVHLIDRALGKVPQKVEQRVEHRGTLTEIQIQCVLSLIAAHGLSYREAEEYVLEHTDEVQEWARQNVVVTLSRANAGYQPHALAGTNRSSRMEADVL